MGTPDTARAMFDPRKHYTGKWTLQGRLIADFDENDRESILLDERRRALVDVVGPYGSPDDGFRVANVRSVGGLLEFDLLAGTLYLGGLRLEMEERQTFRTQRDLLQIPDVPAAAPAQPNRRDLVLLEAFEAPVTAVEDGELLDPAVGVDTSARSRRFQRIHVLADVGAKDCEQAWQHLQNILDATEAGTLGPDHRQVVDTRLTVTYTEEGVDDDLCEPPLVGGYLGAENQAIRVQLTGSGELVWGFDNASPLYRVSLSADRSRVTLITPPRDLYGTPVVGQVIEILPWGAVLSNGEKTAALSGHLTRITAVDPSNEAAGGAITVTLADAVPVAGFDDWQNRPDAADLQSAGASYFMHLWNRGGDVTSPPAVPYTAGTPVTLGTTGIQVTITGNDAARDDYWIIAARPETPTEVLPWEMEIGAAPHGLQRFYAPLGLIRWKSDGTVDASDCRPPFRPLTSNDCCCTYTVGDGQTSDGDYNDLSVALERLGASGGEICLLPGLHRANVDLAGCNHVTIRGCGSRSKLIPLDPDGGAVIEVRDCAAIGFFDFEIISVDGTGIAAAGVDGLRIQELKVLAYRLGIEVDDSEDVAICRCIVRMLDKEGGDVGIYAQGDRLLIEECDVQIIPAGELPEPPDDGDEETPPVDPTDPCADPGTFYGNLIYLLYYADVMWGLSTDFTPPKNPYLTLGGLQIGSGSEGVIVRLNTIVGGAGNGITLGSDIADVRVDVPEVPPDDDEFPEVRLTHDFDLIRGKVIAGNDPIGGIAFTFDRGGGDVFTFSADAGGTFDGKLPPGEYIVATTDPHYAVVQIEPLGRGDYFVFVRERRDQPPEPTGGSDLLAFIYDVAIENNRIANMGFSGIGSPRFVTADAAALRGFGLTTHKASAHLVLLVYLATGTVTGFVVDLSIHRNTITRCLQNAPVTDVDRFAVERALGGISLALCDGVNIEENVIEDCGRGAEMPVCGVFIAFSVDVTIRENRILNNGQDRRAERLIDDYVAAQPAPGRPQPGTAPAGAMHMTAGVRSGWEARYRANSETWNRYRGDVASGKLTANVPDVDFGRGPRAGILLPICLSANVFAGGAAREKGTELTSQGITGAAEARHAARIDGNYVVQPFGKSLFVGAAGSLSITDNQLISDQSLDRELDALAGGLSGRFAARLRLGTLDLFASNVMVVNICPGGYVIDAPKFIGKQLTEVHQPDVGQLQATRIPFGFPDGNILFAGNQIKQGDAGARPTSVTVFSMDDVNFVDNQIDALNATDIRSTSIVFGATARAANNRMKEPLLLALQGPAQPGAAQVERFSLVEIAIFAGGMLNNQGHYCFQLLTGTGNGAAVANLVLLPTLVRCGDTVQPLPDALSQVLLLLLRASANFAASLHKLRSGSA